MIYFRSIMPGGEGKVFKLKTKPLDSSDRDVRLC